MWNVIDLVPLFCMTWFKLSLDLDCYRRYKDIKYQSLRSQRQPSDIDTLRFQVRRTRSCTIHQYWLSFHRLRTGMKPQADALGELHRLTSRTSYLHGWALRQSSSTYFQLLQINLVFIKVILYQKSIDHFRN